MELLISHTGKENEREGVEIDDSFYQLPEEENAFNFMQALIHK